MKQALILILLLIITSIFFIFNEKKDNTQNIQDTPTQEKINPRTVSYNGFLKTKGSKLVNSKDEEIQLRGISSHGLQWYKELYTYDNLKTLHDTWNTNVFRIAMYTDPNQDGYIKNNSLKEDVIAIVDRLIELDMYVIIDWHILADNNPQTYQNQAITFFTELSQKYANKPNVIYEICNEPNGNITWDNNVKPYAETLINVIRQNAPNALIIVGLPEWCKDLTPVSKNPLSYNNIIYSVHFYAGTDGQSLRNKMDDFLTNNLPIFVSECGITDNTGNGKIYEYEFKEWVNYLNENNISWLFWSFSTKEESSSILTKEYTPYITTESSNDSEPLEPQANDLNNYLTSTGQIIKNILISYTNN